MEFHLCVPIALCKCVGLALCGMYCPKNAFLKIITDIHEKSSQKIAAHLITILQDFYSIVIDTLVVPKGENNSCREAKIPIKSFFCGQPFIRLRKENKKLLLLLFPSGFYKL